MATLLRGRRKGEMVHIAQFANDWCSLQDGTIVSPTTLAYTLDEFERINADTGKGDWLYDWRYREGTFRLYKAGGRAGS